jgi:PKD repeat protein
VTIPFSVTAARSVTFSPDGKLLALGRGFDVEVWDIVQQKQVASLSGHEKYVFSVAFSPDGRLLASGSPDGRAIVWDVGKQQPVQVLLEHVNSVNSVAFSPDRRWLASGSADWTVSLWKSTSTTLAPQAQFTATPDGGVAPLRVQFQNTSTGDVTSYLWDFGDRQTSTEQSPTHTYTAPGQYTVTLTVTGPGGTSTATQTILVKPAAPQAPSLVAPVDRTTGVTTPVTLQWQAVVGATSYQVQVSTSMTFETVVVDQGGVAGTSYIVNELRNNQLYYWRVRASNAGGAGA